MREPGRLRSLRDLALSLDHDVVDAAVAAVRAPAIILVGAGDPDYKDPAAELAWMGEQLDAETVLVAGRRALRAAPAPRRRRAAGRRVRSRPADGFRMAGAACLGRGSAARRSSTSPSSWSTPRARLA